MTATTPNATLPPGPRWPKLVQAVAFTVFRPRMTTRLVRSLGPTFRIFLPLQGPVVVLTDPAHIRQVFHAQPSDIEAPTPSLDVMFGPGSSFGLTGADHKRRRKLLVPPFHGKRMRAYENLVTAETMREISTWPQGEEFPILPATMRITLNVILRAVFGAEGKELDELREFMPRWVELGSVLFGVPVLQRDLGPWSPWGRHLAYRRRFDGVVDSLIAKALVDPRFEERDDILALFLRARYDDGEPMSRSEIGDELATLLAAGHETTATTLAWAIERLRRHPDVLSTVTNDVDAGSDVWLQATIHETLRTRPVIDGVVRRVVAETYDLGPWVLPHDHAIFISASAAQQDPERFEHPHLFDPQRFLGEAPDPLSWIPFGGGTRRCIGAAFANMELTVALRIILQQFEIEPTTAPDESRRFRGVAYAPGGGGRVGVRRRTSS